MGIKVGGDFKLYYNSATNASPTWVLISKVGDVTLDLGAGSAEVNLRSTSWDLKLPARLKVGGLNFQMASDIAGTVWEALRGFYFGRTQKQFAVTNDLIATTGTQGFKFFGFFESFPIDQPLTGMAAGDCVVQAGYTEESSALVEPSWFTVS